MDCSACSIVISGRGIPRRPKETDDYWMQYTSAPLATRPCIGPLFSYFDRFAALLRREGYIAEFGETEVRSYYPHAGTVVEGCGLALEMLDEEQLSRFLLERRHRGRPRGGDSTAHQFLGDSRDPRVLHRGRERSSSPLLATSWEASRNS